MESSADVDPLAHRCRSAEGQGVVGAIELAAGELDPSVKQGRSGSRREALGASGRAVEVSDLDRDAAFQRITEPEERTRGVGPQEGTRSLNARERPASSTIGEPHSRERELADEREGGTHVFAHRE